MYKIGVVGDKESILGFQTIGLDTFFVNQDAQQIKDIINGLIQADYAIIYLTEKESLLVQEYLTKIKSRLLPAVVIIPNNKENLKVGINRVKEYTKKAVGIDIVFKSEEGE